MPARAETSSGRLSVEDIVVKDAGRTGFLTVTHTSDSARPAQRLLDLVEKRVHGVVEAHVDIEKRLLPSKQLRCGPCDARVSGVRWR